MENYTGRNCVVPRTIYVPSTPQIYLCPNVSDEFKEALSWYFPRYKLSVLKSATHLIMNGEKLSLHILFGLLRGCIIYDQNSKICLFLFDVDTSDLLFKARVYSVHSFAKLLLTCSKYTNI